MAVAIYRNRLNEEMKRFGNFIVKIQDNLSEIPISIDVIYTDKRNVCLEKMKECDTIVIISHGSTSEIYHRFDHKNHRHQILISVQQIISNDQLVVNAIKGKKIIAISCGTAQKLGEVACNEGGCLAYLGFFHKIHFDKINGEKPSIKYHNFLVKCYKETFAKIIEKAIVEEWQFSKLELLLNKELKRHVLQSALNLLESRPSFYKNQGIKQAIIAVSNVADNIKTFGNTAERIC